MTFKTGGDLCLGFFAKYYDRGLMTFPQDARVLEIGSAEADWITPMRTVRPDLDIVGIDVRRCRVAGVLCANVLTATFPSASFDAIVSVSAIEHIGLGAYGDPIDADGDTHAMRRAASWLKPGGWIYLDVPNGPYTVGKKFRRYDQAAIASRLVPEGCALRWSEVIPAGHEDAPYVALVIDKA